MAIIMLPFVQKSRHQARAGLSLLQRGGFALMEVFIALAVLGTIAAGAYIGFNEVNAYAVSSRLYSEAQAVAQNQIDLILSRGPFNITSVPQRVPDELKLDSQRSPAGPLVTPNVFVYTDPVTGKVVVTGSMTTSITDANAFMAFPTPTPGATPTPLNVRRATVTVSYTFRNKNYNIIMETLRTADQ